mmetsp:Transcript_6660/g.11647  ORF Transcript_6660/g.11647 Transcript_6660/m.11647 type:complete len:175 (-) Transcript_6660:24-548(-)
MVRMRFACPGGGPAPIFVNPCVGLCLVLVGTNGCAFLLSFLGIMIHTMVQSADGCQANILSMLIFIGSVSSGGAALFQILAVMEAGSDTEWISLGLASLVINLLQIGAVIFCVVELMKAFTPTSTCFTDASAAVYMMIASATFFVFAVLGNLGTWTLRFIPDFRRQFKLLSESA